MALIPADVGLRMRQQNELLPLPAKPVQEIPADLPELKAGQTFSARIQEVLPENTFRALVAGKTITLSLPESAKSGDTLELVVVDRTPKTIIARLATPGGVAQQTGVTAYPDATFSRGAQLLRTLLLAEGEKPQAAPLNRGQPMLAQAPRSGADLVPVLSKAVAQSGLFYEAHQARWISGKLPLANLLHEPQGRLSAPQAQVAAEANKQMLANIRQELQGLTQAPDSQKAQTAAQTVSQAQAGLQQTPQGPQGSLNAAQAQLLAQANKLLQAGMLPEPHEQPPQTAQAAANAGGEAASAARPNMKDVPSPRQAASALALNQPAGREESAEAQRSMASSQAHLTQGLQSVPEELRLLVQQQLDAAGTQRLLWHGEVWPGQTMQWRVEWEGQDNGETGQSEPEPWSTTLRLTTPRLGEVVAALKLGPGGVRIALTTLYSPSVAVLREGTAELAQALEAAGVPLRGLTVKFAQESGNSNPE